MAEAEQPVGKDDLVKGRIPGSGGSRPNCRCRPTFILEEGNENQTGKEPRRTEQYAVQSACVV